MRQGLIKRLSSRSRIELFENDNQLVVNAQLYKADGTLLCSVRENKLTDLNPKGYDSNYALEALEVVDETLQPVFQVYVVEPNIILLGFRCGVCNDRQLWAPLLGGVHLGKKPHEMAKFYRLFKYPSAEHSGQMETKTIDAVAQSYEEFLETPFGFHPNDMVTVRTLIREQMKRPPGAFLK